MTSAHPSAIFMVPRPPQRKEPYRGTGAILGTGNGHIVSPKWGYAPATRGAANGAPTRERRIASRAERAAVTIAPRVAMAADDGVRPMSK
jgi:hypothetical protein